MNNNLKRFVLLICIFVFIAVTTTGCSDKSNSENKNMVTLHVLGTAGDGDIVKKFSDKLKEEGIKVDGEFDAWDDYQKKEKLALTNKGGDYDVIFLPGNSAQLWGYNDALIPLNDFVKENNYDTDDYYDTAKKYSKYKGSWIVMPFSQQTMIYYYRKDIYKKNGLKPPKTMDEMLSTCKKVTKGNMYGLAFPAGPGEDASSYGSYFMWSYGGKYFNKNKVPQFNSPQSITAAKMYAKVLNQCAPKGVNNWGDAETIASFSSGNIAAMIEWPSYYNQMNDKSKSKAAGKFGVTQIPVGPGGQHSRYGMWGIGIPKNSKHIKASSKFLRILTNKKALKVWATTQEPSVSKSVNSNKKVIKQNPGIPASSATVESAKQRPALPLSPMINKDVGDAYSSIVSGENPKKELDRLNKKIVEELK